MTNEYSEELRAVFSQLGVRLKDSREAVGMSLQEISARTRINQSFLALIEAGDLDNLPSLAFVKGFVRNYMQALELQSEEVEKELQRLNALDGKEVTQHTQKSNPNLLDSGPEGFPFLKVGLGIGLAILILGVGYFLIRGPEDDIAPTEKAAVETPSAELGENREPTVTESTQGAAGGEETTAPGSSGDQPANRNPIPPTISTPGVVPGTPVEGRQKLELTIRGLEQTWVRISLDRAPPIDVLIEPAETVGWEASQEFLLTIGKSHGVAIYLNGEEFLIPKEKNQLVRDLVLNKLTLLRLEN